MRLVSRHRGGAVVKDDYRDVRSLIDGVDYSRNAGVEECGVADEGETLCSGLREREPLRDGDARSHAEAGIHHIERRGVAERITADVAAVNGLFAVLCRHLRLVERGAVRAAGAEHRRAHGKRRQRLGLRIFGLYAEIGEQGLFDKFERIFAVPGHVASAFAEDRPLAGGGDEKLLLDDGVQLFDDEHRVDLIKKIARRLFRQRIGRANFIEDDVKAELADDLFRVQIGDAGDGHAFAGCAAALDAVEWHRVEGARQFVLFHLKFAVASVGERGEDAPLGALIEALSLSYRYILAYVDVGARVADACRRAQEYGQREGL